MKPIRVAFALTGTADKLSVLLAKVLHTPKSVRGVGELLSDRMYAIRSFNTPQLCVGCLLLRGTDRIADDRVASLDYDTEAAAREAAEAFRRLIIEWNTDHGMDTPPQDVVKWREVSLEENTHDQT